MELDNTKNMEQDWISEIKFVCISKEKEDSDVQAQNIKEAIVSKANLGANECLVSIDDIQLKFPKGKHHI